MTLTSFGCFMADLNKAACKQSSMLFSVVISNALEYMCIQSSVLKYFSVYLYAYKLIRSTCISKYVLYNLELVNYKVNVKGKHSLNYKLT